MSYDEEYRDWMENKVKRQEFRIITNNIFGHALLIPNAALGVYTQEGNVKELKAKMLADTQKLIEMINEIPEN